MRWCARPRDSRFRCAKRHPPTQGSRAVKTTKGLLLGLALLCSRVAGAYTAPPTAPASSANGNYSVSWTAQCSSGCISQWLEEKVGSGNFVSVSSSSPAVYSGKPAGQYTYRLARLLGSYVPPYYMVP